MHFYQFNIGDYAKKTQHLTNEEDLAYRRLLDMYYDTENPVLSGGLVTLSRRLRVSEKALETVLTEFFPDGKNKHADEKIAEYYAYIERQKANGSKGGRRKKNPPLTQAKPSANPSPSQPEAINHESISKPKTIVQDKPLDEFAIFWQAYPRKEAKADAMKAWVSPKIKIDLAVILKAIEAKKATGDWFETQYIPLPASWLRGERWNDEILPPSTKTKLSTVVPTQARTCIHCKEPAHMEISGRWYCRNHDQYSTSEAA